MTYTSNNLPIDHATFVAMQIADSQALDHEREDNKRQARREHHRYVSKRSLDHERCEKIAEGEASKKSKAVGQVRTTNALKDDSLLPSKENEAKIKQKSDELAKPKMPAPTRAFGSSQGLDNDTPNVMAIIARVLIMIANVQVKGWKTFWQMGNQNINTSLQMSQAESQNTELQYQNQASATKTDATRSGKDGMMQIATFAMCGVAGAVLGYSESEAEKAAPSDESVQLTSAGNDAASTSRVAAEGEEQLESTTQNSSKLNFDNVKSGLSKASSQVQKFVGYWFGRGWQAAQMISPGMQGMQALTVDKPLLTKKAVFEGEMGKYAAAATLARGYSEYNNQIFNRTEDVRQGSSQNVDYAMNVYKSASDAMTQAVSAMTR